MHLNHHQICLPRFSFKENSLLRNRFEVNAHHSAFTYVVVESDFYCTRNVLTHYSLFYFIYYVKTLKILHIRRPQKLIAVALVFTCKETL